MTIVGPGHVPVLEAALPLAEGYEGGSVVVMDTDPAVPWIPDGSQGGEASGDDGTAAASWTTLGAYAAGSPDDGAALPEPFEAPDGDLAVLMFTSGTTGHPKGVRLTHGNLFWNAFNVDSLVDTRRRDMNDAVAPLFHIGVLNSFTVRALVRGNTTLVRRTFVPSQVLADIEHYGVDTTFLVPAS